MTRRATAGIAQVLPVLLIAGALAVFAITALLAACGGSNGGESPEPTSAATASSSAAPSLSPSAAPSPAETTTARVPTTLYFTRDGSLCAVERRMPRTVAPARTTLKALFKGPSATERAAGVTTALPPGVKLDSIAIDDGLASVAVSTSSLSDDKQADLAAVAQIVYSLTRYPAVKAVSIRVDGQPYPAASSGDSSTAVWRRRDFRELEPAIFVEHPGLGAVLDNPATLSGSAMVHEGSFVARLVDNSGRRIVSVTVQASRGAPERGRFRTEVAFSTSAAKGMLVVYTQSMEDGSRQNQQRIPVTFATE
jgi:hypothetical protein